MFLLNLLIAYVLFLLIILNSIYFYTSFSKLAKTEPKPRIAHIYMKTIGQYELEQ